MGQSLQLQITLTSIDCGECGGSYAINERYREKKHENGGYWNCPYCKTSWGYGKGENEKLREQIAAEKQRTQSALARENEERAAKDKLARKLRRVERGICPHCRRTFTNLARHMLCKHADTPK